MYKNDVILLRLKELNIKLNIKSEGAMGGASLGGNKKRKLEFLLVMLWGRVLIWW